MNKSSKVIILPASGASNLRVNSSNNKINYYTLSEHSDKYNIMKPQHLYFTSDEDIVIGDFFVNTKMKGIYKANSENVKTISNYKVDHIKKIIATTDDYLDLPRIPESFIEEYVKSNGKIEVVDVEYRARKYRQMSKDVRKRLVKTKSLKLTDKNEIIIHLIEKENFTRDDMIDFAKYVWYNKYLKDTSQGVRTYLQEWSVKQK